MSAEIEQWRPIAGFDRYEISSLGRVRSWFAWGHSRRAAEPRLLAQKLAWNGYMQVGLYRNRKQHWELVARLVLAAFVGPCPDGMEAAHKNGIRSENSVDNLEWKTHQANMDDRRFHGTVPTGDVHPLRRDRSKAARGERNGNSKLTEARVESILLSSDSNRAEARRHGVDKALIGRIRQGSIWRHVFVRMSGVQR